ncbi:MAG: hypothetical protein P4L51_06195 [Puia sp.]|nr:hypothetical protein [Puia sp.]
MLKSISWLHFLEFVLIGTAIYYCWYFLKFYGQELQNWVKGRRPDQEGSSRGAIVKDMSVQDRAAEVVGPSSTGQAAAGEAGNTLAGAAPGRQIPAATEKSVSAADTPELFKVMEKLLDLLKSIVQEATENELGREELLDRFYQTINGFHHLKKTPYEVAINNYLIRACSTNFAMQLTEEELKSLWG